MSLKIGDRVKSYDFVMGTTLLNDKAYVVGDIIDIAPVDWCGDNCDHYHIKILERFDAYGESIEGPDDWMVFPPVYDSMVVLSNWPNDELESETIYDYVTSQDSTCSWCGKTPKFMVYDLPTGPHAFCSEKHYARFVGMDEKPPGWYGYDAESVQKFYMVHRHDAKRAGLHYDLRLEDDGVLKSWAIPKGMPTSRKHLAIKTPDHALSYGKWEGTIKSGYGAGDVKIDTSGKYKTLSKDSKKWKFEILSGKYKGVWTLTKWKNDKWLIIPNKTFGAESNQMFRREATLFGIGVVSAVIGTFLAEMLIDRYREDPELLDTPAPEQNA